MIRQADRRFDIYSELYPASSATIIGAGLVTLTMGSAVEGLICILAGVGVGVAGSLTRSMVARKVSKKHR